MRRPSQVVATYWLKARDLDKAITALCRGQSVGNPDILTAYETRHFLQKWAARGFIESRHRTDEETSCIVKVHWPARNFSTEGLNYLLSVVIGGQCDIDLIEGCRLMELDLHALQRHWARPRYGIEGLRQQLGVRGRVFVGTILKPKIGLTPLQVAEVVKQLADGGCDFIKEDEILADQSWCPMSQRLPRVRKALQGYSTLYAACITADGSDAWVKARHAKNLGATAVHLNLWCGLGTYLDVWRHVDLPLFFQKSGDKVWTTGPYSIDYAVICQLANLAGCDFAHVGMYGGYLAETRETLQRRMKALSTTLPSFSCGMTPELASQIVNVFGNEVMVTSGGWVHGQASGRTEAVKALRRAVETSHVSPPHDDRWLVDRGLQGQRPLHQAV